MQCVLHVKRSPSITIRELARMLDLGLINRINPCCQCIKNVLIVMIIAMLNLILNSLIHDIARLLSVMTNVWWGKMGKANFGEGADLLLVGPSEN